MNIQQLTRLREPLAYLCEVVVSNYQGQAEHRRILSFHPKPLFTDGLTVLEVDTVTPLAALADIEAEIKLLKAAIAEQAKPQEPFADMTWEEFAKISYEAATQHHNDRVTHDGFKIAMTEFYELSGDKIEAWTHGCAVALAAYKNLAPRAREPMSEEEIAAMFGLTSPLGKIAP